MSEERFAGLARAYDPVATEPHIYERWLREGWFQPAFDGSRPTFCITTPPPNVTGDLHLGHALCYGIQDIVGRWRRMQGCDTLLLPGLDHAGISTQNAVERDLAAEGLTRHDLGREAFEERCWEWSERYGAAIRRQFQRLGCSYDWSRERFTLDDRYADAVYRVFEHYWRKGYIYRGPRVVNWCPRCRSSISDLEVEHVEVDTTLWTFRYPLVDGLINDQEYVQVATTRPETMLGDTAVAVHPFDKRYTSLVGRDAILPLMNRRVPIIADEVVDPYFGTGAVKVTPAHDPVDYEMGLRHNLPMIVVIGEDERMTAEAGPFAGLAYDTARQAVLEALSEGGYLVRSEPYTHSVGTCDVCHTIIEPLLSTQWWVRMDELARPAREAVETGRVRFIPDRWNDAYLQWMKDLRDWCISRQIWWGYRLPAWICDACGEFTVSARGKPPACEHCGTKSLSQVPDVLDTWFSSALWPFAALGWPADTPEFQHFYPTSLMVTAGGIVFLWVARMIFSGLEFTDADPFPEVYINATILNAEGRRMSKSLGTGIAPNTTCDEYGTDATRLGLLLMTGTTQAVRYSPERLEAARNFTNKLWNAARFTLDAIGTEPSLPAPPSTLPERWILSRLNHTIQVVTEALEAYRFDRAAQALYDFTWGEFCDWYIECAKLRLRTEDTLAHVLQTTLRLLHPIMPFITEELWGYLRGAGMELSESIMIAEWPQIDASALLDEAEADMALLIDLIRAIRNARAEHGVPPRQRIAATIAAGDHQRTLVANADLLAALAGVDPARLRIEAALADADRPERAMTCVIGGVECYLPLTGLVDLDAERARLTKEFDALAAHIARLEKLLAHEDFIGKAPAHVVDKERAKLADLREHQARLQVRLVELP